MTTMRSLPTIVESRWATTSEVLPFINSEALRKQRLGADIDRGGRFVENDDLRGQKHDPGDAKELFLADR
jgi:hypothetical protein